MSVTSRSVVVCANYTFSRETARHAHNVRIPFPFPTRSVPTLVEELPILRRADMNYEPTSPSRIWSDGPGRATVGDRAQAGRDSGRDSLAILSSGKIRAFWIPRLWPRNWNGGLGWDRAEDWHTTSVQVTTANFAPVAIPVTNVSNVVVYLFFRCSFGFQGAVASDSGLGDWSLATH